MFNRRDFLKFSAAGVGALFFPLKPWANTEDPHFFLQIYIYGGLDSLFLFDGRPQSMVGAKVMHDYIREEPQLWTGDNGGRCLATALARELAPHRQRFSVLNGVFMSTAFDGHLQNVNFLYTGNPFGGESFVPHMNERNPASYAKRPLDVIQSGSFALDLNNGGNSIVISPDSAFKLIESMRKARPLNLAHPVMTHLESRFASLGSGHGRFSAGSRLMANGYHNAPDLAEKLKKLVVKSPQEEKDPERNFIDLMVGCFREGICTSALLQLFADGYQVDTHAAVHAQKQPAMYKQITEKIKKTFDFLATTPYDKNRSLFDVTTVMLASEFGRSLRQPGLPLDATGTDHNSLNNSILIGGKGIRGGLVIGETDWRAPGETLSGAHRTMDPAGLKLMGKPFDFKTCRPRADLPAAYEADDYLTMSSVMNTVYSVMNVPQSKWRTVKRDGPKAPVISALRV